MPNLKQKSTWSNRDAPISAVIAGALRYPCFDDLVTLACEVGIDTLEQAAASLKSDGRLTGTGAETVDRMLGNIRWAMEHNDDDGSG